MELSIHESTALYSIIKAHKGPSARAAITGHALHVLKTLLYVPGDLFITGLMTKFR